jgi:hypothetical protein
LQELVRRRGPNSVQTIDNTSSATETISASTVATAPSRYWSSVIELGFDNQI